MSGYTGFQKKKSGQSTTLIIVAVFHIALGGFLYWFAQTKYGQELLRVYKINMTKTAEPPPPPPEPPPPPPPKEEAPPPPPKPKTQDAPPPVPDAVRADARPAAPVDTGLFAIAKSRGRFAGYADLLTASIQQHYRQPSDLPEDLEYAVLVQMVVDDQGNVLNYKLLTTSGSDLFDQSALEALSKVRSVRPPPADADRTIIVKFFPPTG